MNVELTRFRVKPGKSERVDEWLKTLNERISECLATFEREKMNVEVIFREKVGEDDFLYWFSIQGEAGESVHTSEHDIDKVHLQFWEECIDRSYGKEECNPQVVMIPPRLLAMMVQ